MLFRSRYAEPATETRAPGNGGSREGEKAQEGRRLGNEETPALEGEKLRSAARWIARSVAKAQGSRAREAGSSPVGKTALEGGTSGGQRLRRGFGPPRYGSSGEIKALEPGFVGHA